MNTEDTNTFDDKSLTFEDKTLSFEDKAFTELFKAQTPSFDDSEAFMASLSKRLEAVEYIRQYQEATIRRYKMIMLVALVLGIVSGGVTVAYIMSMPPEVPLFTFNVKMGFLLMVGQNSQLIVSTGIALLMSLGLFCIVSNIHDIITMHKQYDLRRRIC